MFDRFFRRRPDSEPSASGISAYTVVCQPKRAPNVFLRIPVVVAAGPGEEIRASITGRIVGEITYIRACHALEAEQG